MKLRLMIYRLSKPINQEKITAENRCSIMLESINASNSDIVKCHCFGDNSLPLIKYCSSISFFFFFEQFFKRIPLAKIVYQVIQGNSPSGDEPRMSGSTTHPELPTIRLHPDEYSSINFTLLWSNLLQVMFSFQGCHATCIIKETK